MEKLWFIRVGGSAMGPVASALADQGAEVAGSEESLYEPMKSILASSGVKVIPEFSRENIRREAPDAVVVGNAVSRGNPELEEALSLRLPLLSLPQVIAQRLIGRNRSLVVTGTHGKTTTTSMLAHVLRESGKQPGWLIGGAPECLPRGCSPIPEPLFSRGEGFFAVEGDEYDTAFFDKRSKFLWLRPWVGIVNGIEFDHADIFENLEQIQRSFRLFIRLIPEDGTLVVRHGDPGIAPLLDEPKSRVLTFGIEEGDWRAEDLHESEEGATFDILGEGRLYSRVMLPAAGRHNVLNFVAAACAGSLCGVTGEDAAQAARTFRLPKRRMEVIADHGGILVVDDFAHHPTAIKATLQAAKAKWPTRRLWCVFEPRTNTTTRAFFQAELEAAFAGASGVFLGPLDRPWRFTEDQKLNTGQLVRGLESQGIQAARLNEEEGRDSAWGSLALEWLKARVEADDVILILSNGDVGGLRKLLGEVGCLDRSA